MDSGRRRPRSASATGQRLIILPQAFPIVISGMVNLAIGFLLATSLLAVIASSTF
ncbi:hypothetical protein SAMCCGM7_pB0264 (plasmid) [Sinorhizobium americanum CCGM7]|nr:hypothetical protein SAMCCGM7_pB0264 [Sinorhizobium americanum CCGM7]